MELEQWQEEFKKHPLWGCQLTPQREEPLNVGDPMLLVCNGEFVEQMNPQKLAISLPSQQLKYALKILEAKSVENQSATLLVTSYQAGQFNNQSLMIGDGEHSFSVAGLTWNVESVIQNPQQQPFPAIGAIKMQMPVWYWVVWGVGVAIIVLAIWLKLKKYLERRRIVEELETHATALPPFHQFNKDLRVESKRFQNRHFNEKYDEEHSEQQFIKTIDKLYRQYLMRELLVPSFEWGDREILAEIKNRHRFVYSQTSEELKKMFRELKQALNAEDKITELDCEQLSLMSRKIVEKIHLAKEKRR